MNTMESVITYLMEHPFYLPFLIVNIFIIYQVIRLAKEESGDDQDDEDDDDDDDHDLPDGTDLDLPPGVSLPAQPEWVGHQG